jgi:class 3 adenylate cyclase
MAHTVAEILALKSPIDTELLIAVFDLTNFTKFARQRDTAEVFGKMKTFNSLSARFVNENGGIVIKFLGDACLCVFPLSRASEAITAIVDFKVEMDAWFRMNMPGSHLSVNCHVGQVTVGPTPGFNGQSQIDVLGETVNTCFTMSRRGFVISPQAFRSLVPDARKRFRKFTPPIVYHLSGPTALMP